MLDDLLLDDPARRARILYERGRCRSKLNDRSGAIADFECARSLSPSSVETLIDLGSEYIRAGRQRDAIAEFNTALRLRPNSRRALINRAAAKRASDDVIGAVSDLSFAIDLDPTSSKAHYNLGVCHEMLGNLASAEKSYDEAVRFGGAPADCYYRRAGIRIRSGAMADALDDMEHAIALHPNETPYVLRRGLAAMGIDNTRAARDISAYIEATPNDPAARFALGSVRLAEGDLDAAAAEATHAIELSPDWSDAWELRARVMFALRRSGDALADSSRAIELDPLSASAFKTRGAIHAERGDHERAAADFAVNERLLMRDK